MRMASRGRTGRAPSQSSIPPPVHASHIQIAVLSSPHLAHLVSGRFRRWRCCCNASAGHQSLPVSFFDHGNASPDHGQMPPTLDVAFGAGIQETAQQVVGIVDPGHGRVSYRDHGTLVPKMGHFVLCVLFLPHQLLPSGICSCRSRTRLTSCRPGSYSWI